MFYKNVSDVIVNLFPATMHTADRLSLTVTTPMKQFPVITLNLFQTVVFEKQLLLIANTLFF